MRSRPWHRAFVLVAVAALVIPSCGGGGSPRKPPIVAPARPPGGPPNIVVIMTDDQTVESMRVMPKMRKLLAGQGTTFANSYVSYSLCCPSRATYLTGQFAHNHRVLFNNPPYGGFQTFRDQGTTFPVALQKAGYHTIQLGKYLNGYGIQNPTLIPPGWDDWRASVDPSTYEYFGYTLNLNGTLHTYGHRASDYQTDVYQHMAVDIIRGEAQDPRPFFLSITPLAPHAQTLETAGPDQTVGVRVDENGDKRPAHIPAPRPSPRYQGHFAHERLPRPPSFDLADMSGKPKILQLRPRFDKLEVAQITANYRAQLESLLSVDDMVQAIVTALTDTGQLDNTVILFTSDNGFYNGEQRIPFGKFLAHEPSARVPLVIRGPGFPAGEVNTSLVSNVDLAPTILDLARAKALREMDGVSLVPVARPGATPSIHPLLLESGPGGGPFNPVYQGLRTVRYKYIEYQDGEREMYDLFADPNELHNLDGDPAVATAEAGLAATLAQLRTCAGASCG